MKFLVLGATSVIAQETLKPFAQEHADFFLVGRNKERLSAVAADLRTRGANKVEEFPLNLDRLETHQSLIELAIKNMDGLDVAFIAYGTLSNQSLCESNVESTLKELNTNFTSTISLLTHLANYFEKQGQGCIAVITSVAGDRGRKSNYVYGTAKGALNIFLQGLRNRLSKSNVNVLTIKPGFVDTPMTRNVPKNSLFAQPESVGKKIYMAIKTRQDVLYVPGFWRIIMFAIRSVPEQIFKKLSL